jgi:chromate reductase
MKILAISGSARRDSTNTALLRAISRAAPAGVEMTVYDEIGGLPVFSPDLETPAPPPAVQAYVARVSQADGVLIASPEYVRSLPGGLKNAIDWLVSSETLVGKPIALAHASHRGDEMLQALRIVLDTVTDRFAHGIFLRFSLMKVTPKDIDEFVARPENARAARNFLQSFADFCARERRGRRIDPLYLSG